MGRGHTGDGDLSDPCLHWDGEGKALPGALAQTPNVRFAFSLGQGTLFLWVPTMAPP